VLWLIFCPTCFRRDLSIQLWAQLLQLDVKAGSILWTEDSQNQLCIKLAVWRNWKRSPRAGLETCSTGQDAENKGMGLRTKPERKVGTDDKNRDKKAKGQNRASFSQRATLNVTTGYSITDSNQIFNYAIKTRFPPWSNLTYTTAFIYA